MAKNLPAWSVLKREVAALSQTQLVALVKDLASLSGDNMLFLAARLPDPAAREAAREECRRRVVEEFFPEKGHPRMRLGDARAAIRLYRNASLDPAGTLELMLTYVEQALSAICEYEIIDRGPIARSVAAVVEEAVQTVERAERHEIGGDLFERLRRVPGLTRELDEDHRAAVRSSVSRLP